MVLFVRHYWCASETATALDSATLILGWLMLAQLYDLHVSNAAWYV